MGAASVLGVLFYDFFTGHRSATQSNTVTQNTKWQDCVEEKADDQGLSGYCGYPRHISLIVKPLQEAIDWTQLTSLTLLTCEMLQNCEKHLMNASLHINV